MCGATGSVNKEVNHLTHHLRETGEGLVLLYNQVVFTPLFEQIMSYPSIFVRTNFFEAWVRAYT